MEPLRILGSANKEYRAPNVSRRWLLLVAVLLLASGCGMSDSVGLNVNSSSVNEDAAPTNLYDHLLSARQDLESEYHSSPDLRECFEPPFEVLAPADVTGFVAGPIHIAGMGPRGEIGLGTPDEFGLGPLGASVIVRLTDPATGGRWIEFRQGKECYGALMGAPPDAVDVVQDHPIEIPGVDSHTALPRLQSWTEPSGTTVELRWGGAGGTGYQLTGRNVTELDVVRFASSMSPVCCAAPAPTTAVTAPAGVVGQPLVVNWYDGTGTVTIDRFIWDSTEIISGYGAWLVLDVTYRATFGVIPFDWTGWSSWGSTGANTGVLPTSDETIVGIVAGEELATKIRFPSWQASTRVDLSEGGRRVATWSIPG